MSTYAYWRLWVGARMGYIDLTEASDRTHKILDAMAEGRPYNVSGLKIERIYMHGEPVGIGVEVAQLCLETEIGRSNVFDFKKVAKAQALIPKVREALEGLGISAQILCMHHIDLGG